MTIDQIIDGILQREGGYSDRAEDRGGPTNWGITRATASANGYHDDMRAMPQSVARDIYRRRYWLEPGFGKVSLFSPSIAEELADTGVNMGPATAARFLQRALNVLNLEHTVFPDIVVDGEIGPTTLNALGAYLKFRNKDGERVLLTALNCLQGNRYIELAEARPNQEQFVFGWLAQRVVFGP
jgi:lysozyme family protein